MNFYMYGGCEIHDTIPWLQSRMPQHTFIQQGTTTLGSLYSKHGRIADATYEWYNGYPEKSNFKYARKIYREIVTKDFLANIKEYKGNKKDNWIVISFATEAEARYENEGEHITLIKEFVDKPGNINIKALRHLDYPEWILEKLNDSRHTVNWDDEHVGRAYWAGNGDWLPRLGDDIYNMFEDRVILLFTPPARKWYNREHGVYHQLPTLGQYISAYWKLRGGKFWEEYSWEQVNKGYTGIYNGFRRWYSGKTKLVKIRWEDCIGDEHHRMQKSPFHYTTDTVEHIGNRIQKQIKLIENENIR